MSKKQDDFNQNEIISEDIDTYTSAEDLEEELSAEDLSEEASLEAAEDFEESETLQDETDENEPEDGKEKNEKIKEQKPKKKHPNIKAFFKALLITLLIAVLVLAAWLAGDFAYSYIKERISGKSHEESVEIAWGKTKDTLTDVTDTVSPVMVKDKTVLVIGTDQNMINADVIMVARLDADSKAVDIISVPRDTRIKYGNRYYKINASLQLGGEEYLEETVEDILGIDIDNYVILNYEGFRGVIDAIGGVDFYVPQNMYYTDPEQDLYINLKEGQQHLNGKKAEQLVRFRQYPMGDVQRTKVQRDFMMAIFKQKLNSSLVKNVGDLVPALMDFIDTDMNVKDALQYATFMTGFKEDALHTYQMPGHLEDNSSDFVADISEIDKMLAEIEASHDSESKPKSYTYRDKDVDENGLDIKD